MEGNIRSNLREIIDAAVEQTQLAQDRNACLAFVDMEKKLRVPFRTEAGSRHACESYTSQFYKSKITNEVYVQHFELMYGRF
jgi:hypothetical protein